MLRKIKNNYLVITKSENDLSDCLKYFEEAGLRTIPFPTISMSLATASPEIETMLNRNYDYLIFTSANAVEYFLLLLKKIDIDLDLDLPKVIAVGDKTKNVCESNGIKVDLIPGKYSALGIIEALGKTEIEGKKFLIPRSSLAPEVIADFITSKNGEVFNPVVYEVKVNDDPSLKGKIEFINSVKPEFFVFTSPSSFINFKKLLKIENTQKYFADKIIAAIGDTTKSSVENKNLKVDFVPSNFSLELLSKEFSDYIKQNFEY
ncbi:MAG: uroporphyrinogen-III synthase [Melioribacteraceae bacterium]|nr:uroporphyrinogen-III synthase [Melioribacteraceae bacterium]